MLIHFTISTFTVLHCKITLCVRIFSIPNLLYFCVENFHLKYIFIRKLYYNLHVMGIMPADVIAAHGRFVYWKHPVDWLQVVSKRHGSNKDNSLITIHSHLLNGHSNNLSENYHCGVMFV